MFRKMSAWVIWIVLVGLLAACGGPSQEVALGDELLSESFDEESAWETYLDDGIALQVVDGEYRVQTGDDGYIWGLNEASHDDVVIEVTNLVMQFGSQTVLSGLNLKVRRGETLDVMGGSGCSKSTQLRLMIGALKPTSATSSGNSVLNQENITRITIVDHPTVPLKSLPMRRLLIMMAVMMFAGFAGLVVVTFSELLDERFSTPQQLKASFKLPVLTTFNSVKNGSQNG